MLHTVYVTEESVIDNFLPSFYQFMYVFWHERKLGVLV